MYVSQISRYLGDSVALAPVPKMNQQASCVQLFRAALSKNPQISIDQFIRANRKCKGKLQCGDNRLPDGNIFLVNCGQPLPIATGNAFLSVCGDAGSGLLKDCLAYGAKQKPALSRLRGLRGLGDAAPIIVTPEPTAPAPPPISVISSLALPVSTSLAPILKLPQSELVPGVTAETLLQAAQLPNAPPVVVQAAQQLKQQQAAAGSGSSIWDQIMNWFSGEAIPGTGISWGILSGAGAFLLLAVAMKGRR